ncbi:hypothetical protein BDEG_22899 [Batrachochytrium dendrobatidis JEL423]|uniref:Uncharacterized protein n=1 Tax=Batrachochytrium dendrobatidis (strain JEL423) TaxID=403673 RepID=A0A177WFZ4_BATDL|nr:hypothetical protein BDEG_22899 [Batrachochytrium dendrobatidis JEL423]
MNPEVITESQLLERTNALTHRLAALLAHPLASKLWTANFFQTAISLSTDPAYTNLLKSAPMPVHQMGVNLQSIFV